MIKEIPGFNHLPPKGYFYSYEEYKKGVIRIWLNNTRKFDYNLGKPTRTIWGFWKSKTKQFHAPVNSMVVGEKVNISDTRNYTSMPLKLTPLELCFQ